MGTTATKFQFPETKHYTILDYGYCKVWKRNDTKIQTMEQYEIIIQNRIMLESYKQMWQLRTQQTSVVGIYYFTHNESKEICGLYQSGSLLSQRIPYRLSQFSNINYNEILYILETAISAFKVLYDEYGLFQVRSTMIGFNLQREIKVWHHTDFSSALPENANCNNIMDMIQSIIHSVQMNAQFPYRYPRFSQFFKVNKERIYPEFNEILKMMAAYIKMNRLVKPQSLPKLSKYLRQAQGWQQLSYNSNFLTNLSNIRQLNKSSDKYSFRDSREESLKSSRKTIKNRPSLNIYTQKQVNDIFSRNKQQKSVKSQFSMIPSQVSRFHFVSQPLDISRENVKQQSVSINRSRSIDPLQANASFNPRKINVSNNFSPYKPGVSSIEKIANKPSIYTSYGNRNLVGSNVNRINRFNQSNGHQRQQSRSPISSVLYYDRR